MNDLGTAVTEALAATLPPERNFCRFSGCGFPIRKDTPLCKTHKAMIPPDLAANIARTEVRYRLAEHAIGRVRYATPERKAELEAEFTASSTAAMAAWNAAFFAIDPVMEAKRAELEARRAEGATESEISVELTDAIAEHIARRQREADEALKAELESRTNASQREIELTDPDFRAPRPSSTVDWLPVERQMQPGGEVVDTETYRSGRFGVVAMATVHDGDPNGWKSIAVTDKGRAPKLGHIRKVLRAFGADERTLELSQSNVAVHARWRPPSCPKCNQSLHLRATVTGEHPCPACTIPTVHDTVTVHGVPAL